MIEQGARFEVHIEKGRGLVGDHARPFEAQLELTTARPAGGSRTRRTPRASGSPRCWRRGMSVREIAEEVGRPSRRCTA
jgi:putative DNA primase/helicase